MTVWCTSYMRNVHVNKSYVSMVRLQRMLLHMVINVGKITMLEMVYRLQRMLLHMVCDSMVYRLQRMLLHMVC